MDKKTILRKEFDELGIIAKSQFLKDGGRVVDRDPNLKPLPFPELPENQIYRHEWDKLSAREQADILKRKRVVDAPPIQYA